MLNGVNDPNPHREIKILHNGGNEQYVWNTGGPFKASVSITMNCDYGQWKTTITQSRKD